MILMLMIKNLDQDLWVQAFKNSFKRIMGFLAILSL
jgi:hypothetical protein